MAGREGHARRAGPVRQQEPHFQAAAPSGAVHCHRQQQSRIHIWLRQTRAETGDQLAWQHFLHCERHATGSISRTWNG